MPKEAMITVAARFSLKDRGWLEAEACRRKTDRSGVLRALVKEAREAAREKRAAARQAVKAMRNVAEIERRSTVAHGDAEQAEKVGVDHG